MCVQNGGRPHPGEPLEWGPDRDEESPVEREVREPERRQIMTALIFAEREMTHRLVTVRVGIIRLQRNRAGETRPRVITALRALENKRDTNPPKKHGNIPL